MKRLITTLALFIALTVVFSGLEGCKGTQTPANNANSNGQDNATAAGNGNSGGTVVSPYPMLISGIADAPIELTDGTTTKVSERKGKVILLNLWGIWCGPCRAEMPALAQMQQQYGPQGFEVIGLNIGDADGKTEDMEKIKKFGTDMNLNYTIGRIDRATTNQVYLLTRQEVVPQSILISRDGRTRGVFVGGGGRIVGLIQETLQKALAEQ